MRLKGVVSIKQVDFVRFEFFGDFNRVYVEGADGMSGSGQKRSAPPIGLGVFLPAG